MHVCLFSLLLKTAAAFKDKEHCALNLQGKPAVWTCNLGIVHKLRLQEEGVGSPKMLSFCQLS